MRHWATTDQLGEIAYGWKKHAVAAAKPIGGRVVRCRLGPLAGDAWIVLLGVQGVAACELTLVACDGRRIPVLSGNPYVMPQLIGLRGGTPKPQYEAGWRAVKQEVFEAEMNRVARLNFPDWPQ